MADEHKQPDMLEPLGPAYEALQRRLSDDGASWRAGLPSTERLEQRLKALASQEQRGQFAAEATKRSSGRLRLVKRPKGDPSMFQGRIRVLTAAVAVAAIVALFVLLFQNFAQNHSPTSTSPQTATAAATALPTSTPTPDQSYLLPVIAPSNPQTVYRLAPGDTPGVRLVFQASADGGASWHNFPLPAQSSGPQPILLVSPLDAQTVFVSLGGTFSNDTCVPYQSVHSSSTLSSGDNVCGLEYVSQDGGAHWAQLIFSSNELFGLFVRPTPADVGTISRLQVQGTRLYMVLGFLTSTTPSSGGIVSPRLVSSDDGGLTWQVADNDLFAPINKLCDAAPAPTGSTIFALLASADTCVGQPLTLWRSEDAGAHWTRVGQIKNNVDLGMVVVNSGNPAQPLLYLNAGSSICPANSYLASRPVSSICGGAPANLQVSADGGKTWQAAPKQGYPDEKLNPGHPWGVLSDGSVVFLVKDQFYSWKREASAWQRVGPAISGNFQYALVTTNASGHQTLWVVTSQGSSVYTLKGYPL
jgi:photosystem II stability/assembly factor-like uncharacterized protein